MKMGECLLGAGPGIRRVLCLVGHRATTLLLRADSASEAGDTGSVRNSEAPEGCEQRIGGALDDTDETVDELSCDAREKERGGEADQAAGEDIERVVRSDEHAACADNGGCGEKNRRSRGCNRCDQLRETSCTIPFTMATSHAVAGAACDDFIRGGDPSHHRRLRRFRAPPA